MIDVVVARYNEDVSWLDNVTSARIIIYNKGNPLQSKHIVRNIPNHPTGREADTYLHHIIEYYEELAETTWFVQGNPFDHLYGAQIEAVLSKRVGTFEYVSGVEYECDAYGQPHHPGLQVRWFYNHLVRNLWDKYIPDTYKFTPGAQFGVNRGAFWMNYKDDFIEIRRRAEEYDLYAWGMERVWRHLLMD